MEELISGKMSSKGQVTIPKKLRDKFKVNEGDQFKFLIVGDEVKVEPVKKKRLGDVIGKIKVSEPIDLEKMREIVHKKAAKEIIFEGIEGKDE